MDLGGWAFSAAPVLLPSCPAGEPAQMARDGTMGSFPKPEMEAGAYLGGGGRKPVSQAGSQTLPWKQALWWLPCDQGPVVADPQPGVISCQRSPGWSMASLPGVPGHPTDKWVTAEILFQKPRDTNQGQTRRNLSSQPKQTNQQNLCAVSSPQSQVR